MTEKEEYNAIRDSVLSEGMKIFLQDIKKNATSSDTIKVMPLVDNGVVLCSQTDQMLKRLGYVEALDWVTGLIEYYQNNEYKEV